MSMRTVLLGGTGVAAVVVAAVMAFDPFGGPDLTDDQSFALNLERDFRACVNEIESDSAWQAQNAAFEAALQSEEVMASYYAAASFYEHSDFAYKTSTATLMGERGYDVRIDEINAALAAAGTPDEQEAIIAHNQDFLDEVKAALEAELGPAPVRREITDFTGVEPPIDAGAACYPAFVAAAEAAGKSADQVMADLGSILVEYGEEYYESQVAPEVPSV